MTAAEDLYGAYATVPLDPAVEFCDHCVTEAEVRALHTTPLRELTAEQLGPLLFSSTTTWGDIAYFRHFLPRMLELAAAGSMNDWSYPSFLPSRLVLSREHDTPEQAAAIGRFFAEWWSGTLATWPPACDATEVYDTLTEAGVPAPRLLDAWRSAPALSGARHLAAFAEMKLAVTRAGAGASARAEAEASTRAEAGASTRAGAGAEASARAGAGASARAGAGASAGAEAEAGAELREWLLGPVPAELLTAPGDAADDAALEELTDALLTITEARAA